MSDSTAWNVRIPQDLKSRFLDEFVGSGKRYPDRTKATVRMMEVELGDRFCRHERPESSRDLHTFYQSVFDGEHERRRKEAEAWGHLRTHVLSMRWTETINPSPSFLGEQAYYKIVEDELRKTRTIHRELDDALQDFIDPSLIPWTDLESLEPAGSARHEFRHGVKVGFTKLAAYISGMLTMHGVHEEHEPTVPKYTVEFVRHQDVRDALLELTRILGPEH